MPKTRKANGRYATKRQYQIERVENLKRKLMMLLPVTVCTLFSAGVYMSPDIYSQLQPEPVVAEAQVEPTAEPTPEPTATPEPTPIVIIEKQVVTDEQSQWIADAVNEFLPTHRSESLMIMHCLAHRENGHGGNPDGHGDNGKAGGPFQFWNETWTRMRGRMIADGVADEIGSRYDFKEAARTTAYAISKGWAREWGPIYRDSNGSDFATCQTPSWY